MAEYITKEQAKDICGLMSSFHEHTQYLKSKIDELPAADVVEVVHARWVNGRTIIEDAVCSNCNTTYQAYYSDYQYCPRCGARMDGGESDVWIHNKRTGA